MTHEIGMWEIDEGSEAVPVQPTDRTTTEKRLEDILAANPHMLMPGLTLVGRQTPTDGGALDLLGLDSDGGLIVFELKRGTLTRKAVAQVLDYGSYLNALPDLENYVARHAKEHGPREEMEDFGTWYSEQFDEQDAGLRPVRMVLVGLGVDANAQRMVEFLQESGVNINLLTFHGFLHNGKTFLVKQLEGSVASHIDRSPGEHGPRMSREENRNRLLNLANEYRVEHWQDAVQSLRYARRESYTQYGVTFKNRHIILPKNVPARGSHSVVIDQNNRGKVKITFYPASVDLLWDEFHEVSNDIRFRTENPRNAYATAKVEKQWYCVLNAEEWQLHKERLRTLAKALQQRWNKVHQEQNQGP